MSKLLGIIFATCPRCHEGHIFKPGLPGLVTMNDHCAVCGLNFMREPGYYTGAMYVSYFLGVGTILPVATYLGVYAEWPLWIVFAIVLIQTLLSMLIFLRLSRTIWLYFDHTLDPSKQSPHS